jgi:hypothetical protein
VIRLIIGSLIVLVGLPFLIRGWIFFLRPEHAISKQAQERNLRLGLETDMKRWGRRVRRMGFLIVAVGAALAFFGYRSLGH